MNLSTKQIKKIKRLSSTKSPKEIAKELRISKKDVENVLGINTNNIKAETNIADSSAKDFINHGFLGLLLIYICVAPFWVKNGIYDFANLPQNIFIQIGILSLLILWFIKQAFQGGTKIGISPFHLPLFLFLVWAAISISWAANKFEGSITWMQWAGPFLAFLLTFHCIRDKRDCWLILFAIFISGIAVSLLGIGQYIIGIDWVPQVAKPSATFANKNMAAHYAVLTIPLGIGFFLCSRKPLASWFYAISCSLMIVFIFYTRARAGWLSFAAEMFCITIFIIKDRKNIASFFKIKNKITGEQRFDRNKLYSIIVSIILLLILIHKTDDGYDWKFLYNQYKRAQHDIKAILFMEKPKEVQEIIGVDPGDSKQKTADHEAQITESVQKNEKQTNEKVKEEPKRRKESSFAGRIAIWRNSFEMIKDYFIKGVGLGNHKVYYPLYFRKVVVERWFSEQFQLTNAHNDYVQTWSETGTIGMLLLAWFAAAMAIVFFTTIKVEKDMRYVIMGASICVFGLLANAFASFPFQRALPPLLLMLYVAVAGWLYVNNRKTKKIEFPPLVLLFLAIFTFIGLSLLYNMEKKWLECDRYYLRITSAEKAKMWKGVIREAKAAIALNPHRRKILSYMGRAYIESGNAKEGIKALTQVIEVYPYHMNAMLNLGVAYGNQNDFENALKTYEKVINIKPDYAKVHNNIANIYMKQHKLDDALREFRLAAQFDPENPVIHFNVGIVALNKKYYEEARDAFKKALEKRPNWDMAHKNLGVVLYQYLNEKQEGAKHFKEALRLNPKMKDADQMKRIIEAVFSAPKKAVKVPDTKNKQPVNKGN